MRSVFMTSPDPVEPAQPSGAMPPGPAPAGPAAAPPQHDPAANKAFVEMRKQLAAKEKELEAFKQSAMSEQEKVIAAARTQGADEWRGRYLAAAKTNAVLQALTAKGVVAPELALGALNLADLEIDDATGRVDPSTLDQ